MARESSSAEVTGGAGERAEARGEESLSKKAARARAVAEEVGGALKDGLRPVTERVGSAMRSGIGSVEQALEDPTGAMSKELELRSNLPEIEGADALISLGKRLDREADLWREVAMERLTRAAWMDRLALVSAALVMIGEALLAAIAGFRALFAGNEVKGSAVLLGVGALLLIFGTVVIIQVAARLRESQLEVAKSALARVDRAERRLARVAALLALRSVDRDTYLGALRGLEADLKEP